MTGTPPPNSSTPPGAGSDLAALQLSRNLYGRACPCVLRSVFQQVTQHFSDHPVVCINQRQGWQCERDRVGCLDPRTRVAGLIHHMLKVDRRECHMNLVRFNLGHLYRLADQPIQCLHEFIEPSRDVANLIVRCGGDPLAQIALTASDFA